MPRQVHLHIVREYYHVMGRGLERRRIFQTPDDKEDFLARLALVLAVTQSQCLAWALLPNHYSLLIRVRPRLLSYLMRQVLSGYATAYNRRYRGVAMFFRIARKEF